MTAVAVFGAGRMGSLHAEALRSLDRDIRLYIVDENFAAAERLAASVPGALAARQREVWASVDAVVIAAPTRSHRDLIAEAATHQCAIFCEKPVALTLADIDDVLALVEKHDVTVQVGYQRRLDPRYRRLRAAVAAGDYGLPLLVRTTAYDQQPPPEGYLAVSGGIVADCLAHDLDAVRWLTGQDIVEVYATGAVLTGEMYARHADHDVMVLVLRLAGGTRAVLCASRADGAGYDHRLELLGTGGSGMVGWDQRTPADRFTEAGRRRPAAPYEGFGDRFADAYLAEMAAFLELCRGGGDNPCPPREARETIRAVEAARASLRSGRPVALAEIG